MKEFKMIDKNDKTDLKNKRFKNRSFIVIMDSAKKY